MYFELTIGWQLGSGKWKFELKLRFGFEIGRTSLGDSKFGLKLIVLK